MDRYVLDLLFLIVELNADYDAVNKTLRKISGSDDFCNRLAPIGMPLEQSIVDFANEYFHKELGMTDLASHMLYETGEVILSSGDSYHLSTRAGFESFLIAARK